MRPPLADALAEGTVLVCAAAAMGHEGYLEILAGAGFDPMVIDASNGSVDPLGLDLERLVRAADASEVGAIVRVRGDDGGSVGKALAFGAGGLLAAGVADAAAADRLMAFARYAPQGSRGAAPFIRAAGYGAVPWPEHRDRANRVLVLAEAAGAEHADDLLAASISGLVAAPGLAPGDAAAVVVAARSAGRVAGAWVARPGDAEALAAAGAQLLIAADDRSLLFGAAGELKQLLDDARAPG